jgi:hypothetical protein
MTRSRSPAWPFEWLSDGRRYNELAVTRDEQNRSSSQWEWTVMTVSPHWQPARVFWTTGEGARTLSA